MGRSKLLRRSDRLRTIGVSRDLEIERRQATTRANRTWSSRADRLSPAYRYRRYVYRMASVSAFGIGMSVLTLTAYAEAPARLHLKADGIAFTLLPSRLTERDPVHVKEFDPSKIVYRHGDISWLPELATLAGWPENTWKKLGETILRESGGCGTRIGGSIVVGGKGPDSCEIIGYAETNHLYDVGLLQLNGIVYDPKRNPNSQICKELKLCTRESLRDGLNNLRAGLILYKLSGWSAWDACGWDVTLCPKDKKKDN
jgi:hypothetical protein